jgi:hypothetical protein
VLLQFQYATNVCFNFKWSHPHCACTNWNKGNPSDTTKSILVYVLYSLIKTTCFDPLKGSSSGHGWRIYKNIIRTPTIQDPIQYCLQSKLWKHGTYRVLKRLIILIGCTAGAFICTVDPRVMTGLTYNQLALRPKFYFWLMTKSWVTTRMPIKVKMCICFCGCKQRP